MKLYYQFNINPFCHLCLYVMMIDRQGNDRDENGVIRTHAWCTKSDCPQFEKRFLIPPLSVEVEGEPATPVDRIFGRCSQCNRACFSQPEIGTVCGLTQPNQSKCAGIFRS